GVPGRGSYRPAAEWRCEVRNFMFASIGVFFLIASIGAGLGIWNGRIVAHNINDMTTEAKNWFHSEHERATDPKNQKALEAAIQRGGVFKAGGRFINTQVLPAGVRTLNAATDAVNELRYQMKQNGDQANGLLADARQPIQSLNRFILDTNTGTTKLLQDGSL